MEKRLREYVKKLKQDLAHCNRAINAAHNANCTATYWEDKAWHLRGNIRALEMILEEHNED